MSNSWLEPEWKIPKVNDIVKSIDGTIGKVIKSEGTLSDKLLWITNIENIEIYSGEDSRNFMHVSNKESYDFEIERHNKLGYKLGAICSYKGNTSIPLEILQMDWSILRHKMTYCVRDLRYANDEILKTDNSSHIKPFNENFPSIANIISDVDSGLKYKINFSVEKTENEGWTNCGSPLEFNYEQDALQELESFKTRLKIRRIASVLNTDWSLTFPCFSIEAYRNNDGIIKTRVVQVKSFINHIGYFKTACHAAIAMKIIPPEYWLDICTVSYDRAI